MNDFKIHFFNTIWSDAILLEKEGHFALIDTGSKFYYSDLQWFFNKKKINHFDFIILTHFHSDHYGNLANILNDYVVDTLYLKHYYALDGQNSSGGEGSLDIWQKELANYQAILDSAKINKTKIIFLDDLGKDLEIVDFKDVKLELVDLQNRLFNTYNNKDSEFYQIKRFSENFNSIAIFINHLNHPIFLGADMTDSLTEINGFGKIAEGEVKKFYERSHIDHVELYKSCHHGGSGTNPLTLLELLKMDYLVITNTDRWLNNYTTISDAKKVNKKVKILKCDYHLYTFKIGERIKLKKIRRKSLFLKLKKD